MLSSLFTISGLLVILVALGLFFAPKILSLFQSYSEDKRKRLLSLKGLITFVILGIMLISFNRMLFYAEPGYSYLVQYPTGSQKSVLEPGYHARFFGNLLPFKKVITVKFSKNLQEGHKFSAQEIPIEIRFNDAVTATVELAARFRIPEDPIKFKALAIDFRNQQNLIGSCLVPAAKEVVRNSARVISAQEYIVGKGGEFENAVLDQLEKGIYILETQEIKDGSPQNITQDVRKLERKEIIRYKVSKRKDSAGNIIRKKHSLVYYDILVSQATIEQVDPEPKFKEMLSQQRDAAAEANVERQKAKKAEYERQRIVAEGEASKAQIRVDQEKNQIQTLIAIETAMKKEKINVDKRELELKSAELEAQAIKVKANAEAHARKAMMQADNALEQRLNAFVKISQAYAEALKNKNLVPQIVISGNNEGGNTTSALDLINLLTAKTAKDLSVDLTTPQKEIPHKQAQ